jgi:hypothetical protein
MAVSVPPRWLAREGSTVAQTRLPTAARLAGSFPRWMSCATRVAGSILFTPPLRLLATQTAPSA